MIKVFTNWFALFFSFALFCSDMMAQAIPVSEIPFIVNDTEVSNAFLGGIKAPQFSNGDIDLDGLDDLIVFDRDGGTISVLIRDANDRNTFKYKPEFKSIFPNVGQWLLVRDFNNDGVADLFCSPTAASIPGVEIWKGVIVDDKLQFELVTFPGQSFNIVFVPVGSSSTQAYVSVIDLPSIVDVDQDGDLDILAFEPAGSTVFWYRNTDIEDGGDLNTLNYVIEDNCFGKFLESGFSQDVLLSTNPSDCAQFFRDPKDQIITTRHAGSTVTVFDQNIDGLPDLLLGDIAYNGLVYLQNSGTSENSWMTEQVARFPDQSGIPVELELFNSAFFVDVDDNPDLELIVAPNENVGAQTENHIWMFQVTEQDSQLNYDLVSKDFLIDETLFFGESSAPEFFDYNVDGLMDIVIGSGGFSNDGIQRNPRLFLFENIGDIKSPKYELIDDDYLGMSQFEGTSRHFAPAVGDIDGDSDIDMLIGDDRGFMYFLQNNSGSATSIQFAAPIYEAFDIRVSAWAKPSIYDINGDGLSDIMLGEQNFNSKDGLRGSWNYFQNIGEIGNANFGNDVNELPNEATPGQVFLKEEGFINNYSAPRVYLTASGPEIISGTESGHLYRHQINTMIPIDSFELISNRYGQINEGVNATVAIADIDDDNLYELAVGSRRGGLTLFETDIVVDFGSAVSQVDISQQLEVWPSPANNFVNVKLNQYDLEDFTLRIVGVSGRSIIVPIDLNSSTSKINVSSLSTGTYFIEITSNEKRAVTSFVKL